MLDLLVRGGSVIDGTGAPPRRADVAVEAGRVVEVGPELAGAAKRTLDATGALVTPGFVDIHTHYDLCLDWPGLTDHCLRQGITTVVGGNCGLGEADVDGALLRAAGARLGVHLGVLAPFGPVRSRVVPRGEGRPARPDELPRVEAAVATALDAGALGLSWGPYHSNPLASKDELALAVSVAGRRGKPFVLHRRSEGVEGLAATREAIGLARAGGARLHISHLKAAGRVHWGQFEPVLECLEAARQDHDVAVDVYPYDASLTYLSAMLPDALTSDGKLLERLRTGDGRAAAAAAVKRWFDQRQGPESVVVHEPTLPGAPRGSSLAVVARALSIADPIECALRLMEACPHGTGGWATYKHTMAPEQVEHVLDLPWASIASDAVPEEDGSGIGTSTHPRAYSTFARGLLRASAKGEAALGQAVRQMTGLPASRFQLEQGRLVAGAPADLVLLRGVTDRATHEVPAVYPGGVEAVVVAGRLALEGGAPTGDRAGAVLRR